jgi:hypothetical protein
MNLRLNDMFFRNQYDQFSFIAKAKLIYPVNNEGICSTLTNLYIKFASENKRLEFFNKIAQVINCNLSDAKEVKQAYLFLQIVNIFERTNSIYHPNLTCLNAFSFISSNYDELNEIISMIICKLQKERQNRYIHVTFAYFHSFAIEQVFKENEFKYYIYEPNHANQPSPLYNSAEITSAIESSIRFIKFSVLLTLNYSFWKDHSNLLSFYIYPDAKYKKKDYLIENIERRILTCQKELQANFILKSEAEIANVTQIIKICKSTDNVRAQLECQSVQLVEEIGILINKYKKKKAAKGILLNNLSILLTKLQAESNLDFSQEIEIIKKVLKKHILTLDFEPIKNNKHNIICYAYSKVLGESILLHEVARLGDIEATQALLPYSDLLLENCSKRTPLLTAIEGAEFSVLKEILKFIRNNTDSNSYLKILKNLRDETFNIFNSSGQNSTYLIINNILNLIEYEKRRKSDFSTYETSTGKIFSIFCEEKYLSHSELVQIKNNNLTHAEKEIKEIPKPANDISISDKYISYNISPKI